MSNAGTPDPDDEIQSHQEHGNADEAQTSNDGTAALGADPNGQSSFDTETTGE